MIEVKTWRRLGVTAVLSSTVHAVAITLGGFDVPQPPADLPPLAVRIVAATPATSPEPPGPKDTQAVHKPHVVGSITAKAAQIVAESPSEGVLESALPSAPEESSETAAVQPDPGSQTLTTPLEPVVVATAPASTLAAAQALPAFPRKGRITYNLVYGRDQFPVGLTVQSWEFDGARYHLASRSETSGIVDLIRSQHRTYASRGELTPEGFRPETFLMSRNRGRGTEEARAYFNWSSGSVTLGPGTEQRAQALPRGSQDLLSFIFQLALAPPPPGRLRLPVTNGTRLETFELEVLREEKIDTPLGVLRALPVRQVRSPGSESVDLWLAVEYRHLPVRIRFYGRDGEPAGEQIVSEIRLSED